MEGSSKKSRILSLSMRPHTLNDLVGQKEIIESIQSQFESNRIPHFYILSGPSGGGKTTIARILALKLQGVGGESFDSYKKYDIREINAANQTGVDDMRVIIESMRYQPISPSKAKVVILDEAHQLSVPAQNVLITETEDVKPHVFYIFCTSIPSKIIDALKRRAFHITPKPMNPEASRELVTQAMKSAEFSGDVSDLLEYLSIEGISSPGLILQACERFFLGLSPSSIASSSLFESLSMCRAVANGNWDVTRDLCKNLTRSDVPGLKASICGYLKSILLKTGLGGVGMNLANAIKIIDGAEELPVFVGSLFTVCGMLKK